MEARVSRLEEFSKTTSEKLAGIGERLVRIETKLENISGSMATKAEMHDMTAQMVKWIVGTAVGLAAAGITVMTFVLNNATPKAQTAQQAPIIITVPSPAPVVPTLTQKTTP